MKSKYDVFICYNSKHRAEVEVVVDALENASIKPWFDQQNLVPGGRWIQELEQQISTVKVVAVFIGAEGIGRWQLGEIESILGMFLNNERVIIPVILQSVIGDPDMPFMLRQINWVDLRRDWQRGVHELAAAIHAKPTEAGRCVASSLSAKKTSPTHARQLGHETVIADTHLDDVEIQGDVKNIGVAGMTNTSQSIKASTRLTKSKIVGSVINTGKSNLSQIDGE